MVRHRHFTILASPGNVFPGGKKKVKITISEDAGGKHAVLTVRPEHSRQTYTKTMEWVARAVMSSAAKEQVWGK